MSDVAASDAMAARAELMARLRAGSAVIRSASPEIRKLDPHATKPLSPAQQRIVFVQELYREACFNSSLILQGHTPLSFERLGECLDALATKHEILRTNPLQGAGGAQGQLNVQTHVACDLLDLSSNDAAEQRELATEAARQSVNRPFDIYTEAPLLRALVIVLDPDAWLLVLVFHALVCDAPSAVLLTQELSTAYGGTGQPVLTPAPFQYADYVAWSARRPATPDGDIDYWSRRLSNTGPLLLPTDRSRATAYDFGALRVPVSVSPMVTARLRSLAQDHGASLYMTLLAILMVTLARHSAERTVTVGAWTARRGIQNAKLVGPFVNTIVYQTDIPPEETFHEVLERVKAEALSAYAHADTPFQQVVAALNPVRKSHINPLFQAHFILQDTRTDGENPDTFSLSELDVLVGGAGGYDIELVARDTGDVVQGYIECSRQLFGPADAERLHDRLMRVLDSASREPGQQVGGINLGEAPEAVHPVKEGARLAAVLDTLLEADPDSICLESDTSRYIFADLRQTIARLERWLQLFPSDGLLVLACPHDLTLCAGLLASLRLGIPVVSVGDSPETDLLDRLAGAFPAGWGLTDPRSPAVAAALAPRWQTWSAAEICDPGSGENVRLKPAVRHDGCALVSVSSGTGGRATIARLSADALANHIEGVQELFGLSPGTRALAQTDPRFDVAIEEIVPTLCAGGRVVTADVRRLGLDGLTNRMQLTGVTVANLSSGLWQAWTGHLVDNGRRPPDALTTLVVGSEPVPVGVARAWRSAFGEEVRILNAYGLAEATITSTAWEVGGPDTLGPLERLPIGKPLPGVVMRTADLHGAALPDLAVGEIWIGGRGVAMELAEGESTSRLVFRDGVQWLRTGDLGRRRPDGCYELLGRKDQSAKLGGRSIDLRLLRELMLRHTELVACAIRVEESEDGVQIIADARLSTSSALRSDPEAADQLFRALTAELSIAGYPGVRLRLAGSARRPLAGAAGELAAAGDAARTIARCWSKLVGITVGLHDNLFDCGATSLDCLAAAGSLAASGLHLTVADLYAFPTVQAQVEALETVSGQHV